MDEAMRRHSSGRKPGDLQVVETREKLALREITGRAEEDDRDRPELAGRMAEERAFALDVGRGHGFTSTGRYARRRLPATLAPTPATDGNPASAIASSLSS